MARDLDHRHVVVAVPERHSRYSRAILYTDLRAGHDNALARRGNHDRRTGLDSNLCCPMVRRNHVTQPTLWVLADFSVTRCKPLECSTNVASPEKLAR